MEGERDAGSRGSSARSSGAGTARSRSMPAAGAGNPSPPPIPHVSPMPHTVVDGLDIEYSSAFAHLGGGGGYGAADYTMDYGLGYHNPLARISMSGPEGEFDSARSRLPKAGSHRGINSMRSRSARGAGR